MPITDLTGTTWYFNDTPEASIGEYSINFTSDEQDFTSLRYNYETDPTVDFGITYRDIDLHVYVGAYDLLDAGWQDEAYRTISITDGTDVTNSDFISWLESNATQVIDPPVSISKITDSNNNTGYFASQSYFTSTSTASSSSKVATSPNNATFSDTSLEAGISVHIHFTYANTASSYTLQVGTSTAKSVSLVSPWEANSIVTFTYDGTNWVQNDVRPVVRSIKIDNTVVNPDSDGVVDITSAVNSYIDSQLTPPVTLIEFSILYGGTTTTYQAEDGMTWAEWCDSDYSTDEYVVSGNEVRYGVISAYLVVGTIACAPVSASSEITAHFTYVTYAPSACN